MIDFRTARLLDHDWWRRTDLLIEELERQDLLETWKAVLALKCALIGNGNLTSDDFKAAQAQAREAVNEILNLTRPWAAKTTKEAKLEQVEGLIAKYKRLVGDPRDPAFMAKMQADLAADRARRAVKPPETDDQRINRLMQERDARRQGR